jgi:hypothetical protein
LRDDLGLEAVDEDPGFAAATDDNHQEETGWSLP